MIMKKQFVKDLAVGQAVNDVFALIGCDQKNDRNGNLFLNLTLRDNSGSIAGRRFDVSQNECEQALSLGYVLVRGRVVRFNDSLQITVEHPLRQADPEDPADFLLVAPYSLEALTDRLEAHIAAVKEPNLHSLLRHIFDPKGSIASRFAAAPAAMTFHHAWYRGLLQHSLEVADLAAAMADAQTRWQAGLITHNEHGKPVSRDLVVTGALLHDMGKIWEIEQKGAGFDYTASGRLIGHIVIGALRVWTACRKTQMPDRLRDALVHLILSHHGKPELGSPVSPMTREAQILHTADKLDVELFYMADAAERAGTKEFSTHPALEGSPSFKPRQVYLGDLGLAELRDDPLPPSQGPVQGLKFVRNRADADTLSFDTMPRPLIGKIAAGTPIEANQMVDDHLMVQFAPGFGSDDPGFILRVDGDSMIGDGINNGDLIAVRSQSDAKDGDIVVALLGDHATVKHLQRSTDGQVSLVASNPTYAPIIVPNAEQLRIQGLVVGILKEVAM
jgi:3'-5' exoribonuclease